MAKVLIVYYSATGNTEKMAELIEQGVKNEGVDVVKKKIEDTEASELLDYDGIIIGSPTYYGSMAWQVKKLLDDSVKYHGKFDGKVGAAFTSAANIGGGNETTIMDILKAMLIHGMIVQGNSEGDHYGRVAVGVPDDRVAGQCRSAGARLARLVKRMAE